MTSFSRRAALAVLASATVLGVQPLLGGTASAAALAKPTGLAPSEAGADASQPATWQKDPVLSWSTVAGATGYDVALSRSDDWSDSSQLVSLGSDGTTKTSELSLPQTLEHGSYWWRVRAVDGTVNGPWSATTEIFRGWNAAPVTVGNAPGSAQVTDSATSVPGFDAARDYTAQGLAHAPWRFSWTALPDASSYEIEFSTVPTSTQSGGTQGGKPNDGVKTLDCLTENTTFTPYSTLADPDTGVDDCDFSSFNPDGTPVYWRVRGIDDSDTGPVGPGDQTQSVDCFGAPNNDSSGGGFPDQTITTPISLGTPSSTGQECSLWSDTHEVMPLTNSGTPAPADDSVFVTGATLTGCTAGTTDGAGDPTYACPSMPEVSWAPVTGAVNYDVTIADDRSFTDDEQIFQTFSDSLTPRDMLPNDTAGNGYYVGVSACFSDGRCTQADVMAFTKKTPALTGLAAAKVTGGERLTWNSLASSYSAAEAVPSGQPAVEAKNYLVEVATAASGDFDNPVLTAAVDGACDTVVTTACYQPGPHDGAGKDQYVATVPSGSYIWRVVPIDESGDALTAGVDSTGFTEDTTRPSLHLVTKKGVAVTSSLTVAASEPVTGVSSHTVHIVPAGKTAAAAVGGTLRDAAGNTWTFHPTHPLATGGSYRLLVDSSVTDKAGNPAKVASGSVTTVAVATDTSKGWAFTGHWTKHRASGARSGSFKQAAAGHRATLSVAGKKVTLFGCKGPGMGTVRVSIDGHAKAVNEHKSFTQCGVALWQHGLAAGDQTMTVKVVRGHGSIDEVRTS